jgi:hypothetical protein
MDAAARWRAQDCADTDSYMNHFYRNVPKLGNVAVSRHAQNRMEEDKISHEAFEGVLLDTDQATHQGRRGYTLVRT